MGTAGRKTVVAEHALVGRTPVDLLWEAGPAFPTRSEVWLKLRERREAEIGQRSGAALVSA